MVSGGEVARWRAIERAARELSLMLGIDSDPRYSVVWPVDRDGVGSLEADAAARALDAALGDPLDTCDCARVVRGWVGRFDQALSDVAPAYHDLAHPDVAWADCQYHVCVDARAALALRHEGET